MLGDFEMLLSFSEKRQNDKFLTVISFRDFMQLSEPGQLRLLQRIVLLTDM